MVKVITYFKVEDFEKWKSVFLNSTSLGKSAGAISLQAFRAINDPKLVAVLSEWDTIEHAKAFSNSSALRSAQQQAGISTAPDAYSLQLISRQ